MGEMVKQIAALQDYERYQDLHWEGSFEDYLQIIREKPQVTRNAFQRLYDMVISYGEEEYIDNKKKLIRYPFFKDPVENGKDAIFGLDIPLMRLVHVLHAAAQGYGPEKRIILLHGPVGSSKSTIARLLKKGLERYSRTAEGALYTYEWTNLDSTGLAGGDDVFPCPMHDEPLRLIPAEWRDAAMQELRLGDDRRRINVRGELNPACRFIFRSLLERYDGDWSKVMGNHIKIKRLVLSEQDRDPRAFNFDGEFNIANRGVVEFVEVLKLDVAFLYDLLGATQEHKIKPKKFAQTDIDEVIIGHTNEAEYKKLINNEFMEALRDRTIKIDIPYITKMSEEIKIYQKDFSSARLRGKHVAPHTLEVAAMWAVLSRLEEPKKHQLALLQKLKLYDGKILPGYTQDNVKELRKEAIREGLEGMSPRYVQDKISNSLVREGTEGYINPFMVLNELEKGLRASLTVGEDQRKRYGELIGVVKAEYDEMVKNEVQRAISADEEAIGRLSANYVDNIRAYLMKEKVKNKYTGKDEEPDERLMRSIEEKIDITDSRKDDFRREIMNFIGHLALEGKKFTYETNDRLRRALEMKLFEDQKDSIKLSSFVSNVIDKETQDRIDIIKNRLIKYFGYNEASATDVLAYVASIFARGDVKE
ncbi:MAG: serine protein kinase [Deltaproteobacteria bacterium]|nr:serine protein kinase [Deltaproteobacteria bacterium]